MTPFTGRTPHRAPVPDHHESVQVVGFDLLAGGEHADGDRQIEAGPILLHIRRCEVNGGAAHRELEP